MAALFTFSSKIGYNRPQSISPTAKLAVTTRYFPMPKNPTHHSLIRTRLGTSDLFRFRQCATARGAHEAALLREAVLYYLDNFEQSELNRIESVYAAQLKSSTNRICAMLAKIAMDARAPYFFVGEDDPDGIRRCREQSGQQINKALSILEADTTQKLANHVQKEPE
jgi:hypothetical protein